MIYNNVSPNDERAFEHTPGKAGHVRKHTELLFWLIISGAVKRSNIGTDNASLEWSAYTRAWLDDRAWNGSLRDPQAPWRGEFFRVANHLYCLQGYLRDNVDYLRQDEINMLDETLGELTYLDLMGGAKDQAIVENLTARAQEVRRCLDARKELDARQRVEQQILDAPQTLELPRSGEQWRMDLPTLDFSLSPLNVACQAPSSDSEAYRRMPTPDLNFARYSSLPIPTSSEPRRYASDLNMLDRLNTKFDSEVLRSLQRVGFSGPNPVPPIRIEGSNPGTSPSDLGYPQSADWNRLAPMKNAAPPGGHPPIQLSGHEFVHNHDPQLRLTRLPTYPQKDGVEMIGDGLLEEGETKSPKRDDWSEPKLGDFGWRQA